jgi:hypothetical protein
MTTTTTTTPTARAAALLTTEWTTVRTALLCYAGDQREAGNDAWADQLIKVYEVILGQTA